MSSAVVWVIVAISAADLVVVLLLVRVAIGGTWRPLAEAFPAREPGEGAVRKTFQSYRLGIINLGYSIHTTVDAEHLHMEPAGFARAFGLRAVSVPWGEVRPVKLRGRRWADVKIGNQTLMGPRWALEMAFVEGREAASSAQG